MNPKMHATPFNAKKIPALQNKLNTWNSSSLIKFGDAKFGTCGITRATPGYNQSMTMLVDYEYVPYGNDFSRSRYDL